ncbi:MAG: hypothetical protein N3B01_11205 [Verrucomicrobiae bacterium]|nr:hypothetical protein [Verrucomicrobiae bacterium]
MKLAAVWLIAAVGAEAVLAGAPPVLPIRKEEFVETLPVFTSGTHSNRHAVYQHEKFLAWITAKGLLYVQPLDAGKPVGRTFSCMCVSPYYAAKGTTYGRRMKDFQEFGQPVVIPSNGGTVRFKGRLEEEVPFAVEYTFEGNCIRARGGCQDRPSTKPPTRFRLLTQFGATHRFKEDTPTEQIKAATAGMTLEVHLLDGKTTKTYPYWQGLKGIDGPCSEMIVRGVFGPRVLRFKPTGREGQLSGRVYTGFRLCQGYYISYTTQGKKINLRDTEVTMIVE